VDRTFKVFILFGQDNLAESPPVVIDSQRDERGDYWAMRAELLRTLEAVVPARCLQQPRS
jgi:hypothetical protein